MITSRWFDEDEFRRCNPPCSLQDMDQGFINKLDAARDDAGIPMIPLSAYRSAAHEHARGRSGTGDHPKRKGADIKALTPQEKYLIVAAALKNGITRIGIYETFVHLGDGEGNSPNVIWYGK